jgi:hypothetical protein
MKHNSWKEALAQLPAYDPPLKVWEDIEENLVQEEAIGVGLKRLPDYDPPTEVWDNIRKEVARNSGKRISLRPLLLRVAAAMTLLVGMWFLLQKNHSGESVSITYSEERLPKAVALPVNGQDEAAFSMVEDWCRQHNWICSSQEFTSLQEELSDLSSARNRLVKALSPYEENPVLRSMLSRIERERSEVLKQMAAMM